MRNLQIKFQKSFCHINIDKPIFYKVGMAFAIAGACGLLFSSIPKTKLKEF